MAIDPSGGYVASAQAASHGSILPVIHIWSPAEVMRERPAAVGSHATLSGTLQGIITVVSFDSTGHAPAPSYSPPSTFSEFIDQDEFPETQSLPFEGFRRILLSSISPLRPL